MSKLEDLVPPLDLCKQIIAGAFADSVLVWRYIDGKWDVYRRTDDVDGSECEEYPAPTPDEIVAHFRLRLLSLNNFSRLHASTTPGAGPGTKTGDLIENGEIKK